MVHPYWPLFDLVIRTPSLELRPPDEATFTELVELSDRGIHDPDVMPFIVPWTREPDGVRQQHSMIHYWRCWADWTTESWHLKLAVRRDGTLVGTQDVMAKAFPTLGVFETGSWLGRAHQGQGIGKEMRAAALHLGFAGLGGRRADTAAFHDNTPSLGVTRALGYEPNGDAIEPRSGAPDRCLHFKLERAAWELRRRRDITIEGLEPCLGLFGIDGAAGNASIDP